MHNPMKIKTKRSEIRTFFDLDFRQRLTLINRFQTMLNPMNIETKQSEIRTFF